MQTTIEQQITKKQIEILSLLYRFRYLNRSQIQKMLGHKQHTRIYTWLNKLARHDYLEQRVIPPYTGVYSLGFRAKNILIKQTNIEPVMLKRIHREKYYTDKFRLKCLLIADIYQSLVEYSRNINTELRFYTRTDLCRYDGLIDPLPNAYFAIQKQNKSFDRYFLEIFDLINPEKLRMRINQYFRYYNSSEWYYENPDKPFPGIIIVCPSDKMKLNLYHHILYQYKLNDIDSDSDLTFLLTTRDAIKSNGLVLNTLEKVIPRKD